MLIYFFVFVFGLIAGSFLNCLIYRIKEKEKFFYPRSFCPYCYHPLSWQDLIPVLSFFILKGKCRYCKEPISWQYPLVETATGLIFVLFLHFHFPVFDIFEITIPQFINFFYYLIIASCLIVIFVYDLKHYIIPDEVIYPATAIALIFNFQFLISNQFLIFKETILGAAGAALFFLFLVLVSKGRWMGAGDIKLAFLMGLVLGWPDILIGLFLAFFSGAIIGVGLMIAGKKKFSSKIPFGPFLTSATFLAIFFGEDLINWYLSLIAL